MYEPSNSPFSNLAFFWPALAAASASEIAAAAARRFIDLAVGPDMGPAASEPKWATPNTIALELKTVLLRDFSIEQHGLATLVCAPLTLHGAAVADFAPGHSLVATLRDAGISRVFVTDWRSAQSDMRFLAIDNYLADLNVVVDQLGGR